MSYPFVQAHHDYGVAKGPRRGITWHMAEGAGTVGYLHHENPNGVSVHFVVELSGRIVQMLALTHANGSIRPSDIRTSNDPAYDWEGVPITYGARAAQDVMGTWWSDPNSASIGVEIEGYAKDGPNATQADSLGELWTYLRGHYHSIRSLGHRDFADYKACPGHHLPWDRVGGHGPEDTMQPLQITSVVPKIVALTTGDQLYNPDGSPLVKMSGPASVPSPYETKIGSTLYRAHHITTDGALRLAMVRLSAVTISDPPPAGYTKADLDTAHDDGVAAGRASEKDRIAAAEAARVRAI